MRRLTSLVSISLLMTTVAVIGAPERLLLVVRLELLTLAALFVLGTVLALRAAFPESPRGPFGRARSARAPSIPVDLERVHTDLRLAAGSATSVERLLVPRLRAIVGARLRRQGLDLADPRQSKVCATACGPRLWALVDPGRAVAHDPSAPGLETTTLEAIITDLEAV
jgi:hypothetical protein